ncbi:MAG: hypothetical protein LR015_00845 [Verrucomicrobia bacterium]|nr:hypothetical protein [Verrucomicrobiota bacterium]
MLVAAGMPAANVRLLPNSVTVHKDSGKKQTQAPLVKPYFLYPTRAIRRKNIGEVVLLAVACARVGLPHRFALTLAPGQSPVAKDLSRMEAVCRIFGCAC